MVEDLAHSSRPSTSSTDENIDKVKELVLENHHSSLREMTQDLDMSHKSVRTILVDILGIRRVATRLVPKAPSHVSTLVREFLIKHFTNVIDSIRQIWLRVTFSCSLNSNYHFVKDVLSPLKP